MLLFSSSNERGLLRLSPHADQQQGRRATTLDPPQMPDAQRKSSRKAPTGGIAACIAMGSQAGRTGLFFLDNRNIDTTIAKAAADAILGKDDDSWFHHQKTKETTQVFWIAEHQSNRLEAVSIALKTESENWVMIHLFATRADCRRKKYGSRLVEQIENDAHPKPVYVEYATKNKRDVIDLTLGKIQFWGQRHYYDQLIIDEKLQQLQERQWYPKTTLYGKSKQPAARRSMGQAQHAGSQQQSGTGRAPDAQHKQGKRGRAAMASKPDETSCGDRLPGAHAGRGVTKAQKKTVASASSSASESMAVAMPVAPAVVLMAACGGTTASEVVARDGDEALVLLQLEQRKTSSPFLVVRHSRCSSSPAAADSSPSRSLTALHAAAAGHVEEQEKQEEQEEQEQQEQEDEEQVLEAPSGAHPEVWNSKREIKHTLDLQGVGGPTYTLRDYLDANSHCVLYTDQDNLAVAAAAAVDSEALAVVAGARGEKAVEPSASSPAARLAGAAGVPTLSAGVVSAGTGAAVTGIGGAAAAAAEVEQRAQNEWARHVEVSARAVGRTTGIIRSEYTSSESLKQQLAALGGGTKVIESLEVHQTLLTSLQFSAEKPNAIN